MARMLLTRDSVSDCGSYGGTYNLHDPDYTPYLELSHAGDYLLWHEHILVDMCATAFESLMPHMKLQPGEGPVLVEVTMKRVEG